MALSRDQQRKKKLKERDSRRGSRVFLIPKIVIKPGDVNRAFVATVKIGFDKVVANIGTILTNEETRALNDYASAIRQPGVRERKRLDDAVVKLGNAVYEHVLKSYQIPIGTYRIDVAPETRTIDVYCYAFRESKSKFGTRYYSDKFYPSISLDGRTGTKSDMRIGYTRHFLERAMERDLLGTPLQRHYMLFTRLNRQVVLVKGYDTYRIYVRVDMPKKTRVAGAEVNIFRFLGYIPQEVDDGMIVAKTILLPGMRGTPEAYVDGLQERISHMLDRDYLVELHKLGIPLFVYIQLAEDGNCIIRDFTESPPDVQEV